ncbi:hypothetical protein BD769DRAFT_1674412 [Suillus cothurnatus]|nr:hypothetical protein BD769DRAFT_1674412 [Suillus cothurnatus]
MDADGDCELELESEVRPKKKKKENCLLRKAVSAVRLKKQNEKWDQPDDLIKVDQPGRPTDGKAHGLDKKGKNVESKKFSLSGQVNNWQDQVEPHLKGKSSKGASGRSGTSTAPCSTGNRTPIYATQILKYIPQATCSDAEDDAEEYANNDDGEDESDSEEHAACYHRKGKGKAAMKTVIKIDSGTDTELLTAPIAGSGKNRTATSAKSTTPSLQESDTNDDTALNLPLSGTPFADLPYERQLEIRKIEDIAGELGLQVEDDSINYEDGAMEFGDEILEFGDDAMELDSEIERFFSRCQEGFEGNSQCGSHYDSTTVPAVSESMLVDMAIKPAAGNGQWRNTDLPPMLTENGSWRRQFVPTVLLWAGSRSSFWTIEAADLLGPYHGRDSKITQRLCTWCSNFGSTAIALIANFLASLREHEDEDEEEDKDENDLLYLQKQERSTLKGTQGKAKIHNKREETRWNAVNAKKKKNAKCAEGACGKAKRDGRAKRGKNSARKCASVERAYKGCWDVNQGKEDGCWTDNRRIM